jgi:hypothetical protein
MDPKDPLKICLYPSVKDSGNGNNDKRSNSNQRSRNDTRPSKVEQLDDLDNLVLHNYLTFRKRCLNY